ncbi:MAG: hypothetical protein Q7S58_02985 [Candidatus Binatus sp.]|nr:hypothetical protein [Candidatus Binatus sp.]
MKAASIASIAMAVMLAACSSNSSSPESGLAVMKVAPAPPGSCEIDAAKMCSAIGSLAGGSESTPSAAQTTYANATAPESVEFQIPAGQAIKLTCYYDQPHTAIVRADATPESALTDNSVAYMKSQGFCAQK